MHASALFILAEIAVSIAGVSVLGGQPSEHASPTGGLEGVVRYQANPERPWRFSRYYVKDAEHGFLAEAVVALEGPTLARGASSSTPTNRVMDQINFQFQPETMAIRSGDTVRFANSDDSIHNVMTNDGEHPFNITIAKGDEVAQTFGVAGGLERPIRLGCVFHGSMRAWIFVFDHPWFAVTQGDGRFRLENIPAGEYRLAVRHPAGRLRADQTIRIESDHSTVVELLLHP